MTDDTVMLAKSENPLVVSISPFFTIFNEKNVLLLQPLMKGKTNFLVITQKGTTTFSAAVSAGKKVDSFYFKQGEFEVVLMDEPPKVQNFVEEFELDAPPEAKEGE